MPADSEVLQLWCRLADLTVGKSSFHSALARRWDGLGVHRHSLTTLAVCLDGQATVALGPHQEQHLAAGEVAIIGAWCWHAHPPPRHGAVVIIGCTAQGIEPIIAWRGSEWRMQTDNQTAGRLLADIGTCTDEAARMAALRTLLHRLGETTPVMQNIPLPLLRMTDFLWLHRTSPINAEEVLAISGLSPRAAHTLFVDHFGTTPKQYLLQCRLALAQRLLAKGGTPGDIWRECGFRSRADFTRRFRLACGDSPRKWVRGNHCHRPTSLDRLPCTGPA